MIAAIREAIKPNWIDRAVGYVAPVLGAKRMQARAAMALSGYIGARWDRRATKEWYVPSGTADDTILPDSQTLRDRSRDLIRNTPLATVSHVARPPSAGPSIPLHSEAKY